MSRYSMIVQGSEEDRLFLVTIPEFSERVVMPCTHGKSREEAIHNGEEAIEMYLEAWEAEGASIPEPRQRLSDLGLKIIQVFSKYPQGLTIKQIYQQVQLDSEVDLQLLPNLNLTNAVQSLTRRGLIEKKGEAKGTFFILLPILQACFKQHGVA